ncbi:PQQ-dependent sugar dehydrogenase [Sphingomonas gei]|uniref:PQQ-dependent sugar dehydrogenase n=1 Tax=Sphingomonas gei TaxID=1395960 RepID=UPI00144209F8|nr:PQQ-dependent sugar dehydrogenase [Sphingomonas gei]
MPALVSLAVLSACDNDGGPASAPAPTPTPAPVNTAPSFTSAVTVNVPEGQTAPFYNAVAVDAQGTAVSYAISGGADAARFTINSTTGGISFRAAPDFEIPADADGNNVYVVQLTASDGVLTSATFVLSITVTDDPGNGVRARRVASGLNDARQLNAIPDGSGRLFAVERGGLIRIVDPASGAIAATPFLDISASLTSATDRGLQGFALAPDFATSGTFYVAFFNSANAVEVRRYRTPAGNRDQADPASSDTIMLLPHPVAGYPGTWLGFDNDGMLFVANPASSGQPLGAKILRINVNGDAFPGDPNRDYAIPADNPEPDGATPEVWVLGITNVRGASVDPVTNKLWIADQESRAPVYYRVSPSDKGKTAYSGSFCAVTDSMLPQPEGTIRWWRDYAACASPLFTTGSTGGLVYRGPVEALQGTYFWGYRYGNGAGVAAYNLVGRPVPGFQLIPGSGTPFVAAGREINALGEDQSRNLYVANGDGEVFILEGA